MKEMISKKGKEFVKFEEMHIDEEMQEGRSRALHTLARLVMLEKAKWQQKHIKPPKCHGIVASQISNVVEQWLSRWEQFFR